MTLHHSAAVVVLTVSAALGTAEAAMMNARIRFEDSPAVNQAGKSMCLKSSIVQKAGAEALLIEPGEFSVFQPANPKAKVFAAEGSVSGQALAHMKELGWRFTIAEPGEYLVYLRAFFPLAAGYNHNERMDDGERQIVFDSADALKVDKFAPLPHEMDGKWLEPNAWHWLSNFSYELKAGEHFFHWPANGAWCGGCLLDRIVLVKKGSKLGPGEVTKNCRVESKVEGGVITSRRIKTERIARWTIEAELDKGDGDVVFEYSYDRGNWTAFRPGEVVETAEDGGYLYVRIRFTAAEKGVQPMIYSYRFRVEKRK